MKHRYAIAFLLLCSATSIVLAQKQEVQPHPQEAQRPPDGGAMQRIISIFIPSLPNAPFTATVNTEWTRQLGNGTTIAWTNHRTVARDGSGRIFEERRWFVPAGKQAEPGLMEIEISDPVSRQLYLCRPGPRVCELRPFHAPAFNSPLHGGGGRGTSSGNIENLGTQSIEGLEVTGERETIIIESNAMGNDRPLVTKREFWYSPLLGVNLVSKREDPRFGTENFEVTHISIGEPDAKLFEVPAGFTVNNLGKPSEVPATATTASPN
jgi:hypothetical protein